MEKCGFSLWFFFGILDNIEEGREIIFLSFLGLSIVLDGGLFIFWELFSVFLKFFLKVVAR